MSARHNPEECYRCPKCNGRQASTRQAALAKGRIADLLGLKMGGRYQLVTCALCGYTELYDLAVVEPRSEQIADREEEPDGAQGAEP